MKRRAIVVSCAVLGSVLAGAALAQQPSFSLTLDAPASMPDAPGGSTVSYVATGKLTTTGLSPTDPGAQGWSLSMSADGGGSILDVTTAGTIVDSLFNDGFNKTELTTGAGNEGAVSAVVLALSTPVTLPPEGTADIVRVTVEAVVKEPRDLDGDGEVDCDPVNSRVFYIDGRKGSGQPVDNKVTYVGQTSRPTKGEAVTRICAILPARELTFRLDVVGGEATGPKEGGSTPWKVTVPANSGLVDVTAALHLASNLDAADPTNGAQGWSVSVETGPCFNVGAATTAGTAVDDFFSGGFNKTEVVDPAKNSGKQGAVSAVVLSFTEQRNLPPASDLAVLLVAGKIDAAGLGAPGECTVSCSVAVIDPASQGLRGSGQPVQTAVTVGGATRKPAVCGVNISLCQSSVAEFIFVRGNANDDLRVDIADPIWIVNLLFHSGPDSICMDAADANDDGLIDLADAAFLIAYEFMAGAEPPPPFGIGSCGIDPTPDSIECTGSQTGC